MEEDGQRVTLNVYDLSQGMARQLSTTFLGKAIEGIWHTGVVVYGNEYYFGGGIQHDPVGRTPYGKPINVVDLGATYVPKDVFERYLQDLNPRYTAETYQLLSHNCNDFSNEVAQFLVGASIPDYILQLPKQVMGSPMGPLILPMIRRLETTMKSGAAPSAAQFSPIVQPMVASGNEKAGASSLEENGKDGVAVEGEDPMGDARSKVQEEIGCEFASIMATGTSSASEAAALATKRVMQRYGHSTS